MSYISGTQTELIYANNAAGATLASFTTEAQLNTTATMGVQAHLPADFWLPQQQSIGRGIRIVARGAFSTTATPTFTWTIRGGAAANITTNPLLAGTTTLTTGSSVTNQIWKLEVDIILTAIAGAGANSSVMSVGVIESPGLATPIGAVFGGGASPGTIATLDTSIVNYLNVNAACSANSASNSITLLQLLVWGLN